MIILIDAGNSHVNIGGAENGEIKFKFNIGSDGQKSEFEYASQIKEISRTLFGYDGPFEGAALSSVTPKLTGTLKKTAGLLCGEDKKVISVGAGVKCGVNIRTDNPSELGADIVATAAGALKKYVPPLIIADLGTATVISAIDKNGCFTGCAIMPGAGVGADSLSHCAEALPGVGLSSPAGVIGKNTADSIRAGIVYGSAASIDGIVERMKEQLGEDAKVLACGGGAEKIIPYCRVKPVYDPDLTLEGLYAIYEKNK